MLRSLVCCTRVALVVGAMLVVGASARGQNAQYAFTNGDTLVYEVTIKVDYPTKTQTNVGYLMYKPVSADAANGTFGIDYQWAMYTCRWVADGKPGKYDFGFPAFLARTPPANAPAASHFVVDHLGKIISTDGADAQVEGLGPALQLMVQPLQQGNDPAWTSQRNVQLYSETTTIQPGTENSIWGGKKNTTRTETAAVESIIYTAGQPKDGEVKIQRKYDLASVAKFGNDPVERTGGDDEYVFDQKRGILKSFEIKHSTQYRQKNMTVRIPMTASIRLLLADEVKKFQDDYESAVTAKKDAIEKAKAKRQLAAAEAKKELNDLPDGTEKSEQVGRDGGRKFLKVDADHRPLTGLRFKSGEWDHRKCFLSIDPLFETPKDKPAEETVVMAKDGYAIGAISVNASARLNAFCITFMKKTPTGLDPKASYTSPWYGQQQGAERKKLGGEGRLVYGIFGVKNINIDAFGIISEAPPGDPTEK